MKIIEYYNLNKPNILWSMKIMGIVMSIIFVIMLILFVYEGKEKINDPQEIFLYAFGIIIIGNIFGLLSITIAFLYVYYIQEKVKGLLLRKDKSFYETYNLELYLKRNKTSRIEVFKYELRGNWNEQNISIIIDKVPEPITLGPFRAYISLERNVDKIFVFEGGSNKISNIKKSLRLEKINIDFSAFQIIKRLEVKEWLDLTIDGLSGTLLELERIGSEIEFLNKD